MSKPVRTALSVMLFAVMAVNIGRSAEPLMADAMTYDAADGQRYFRASLELGHTLGRTAPGQNSIGLSSGRSPSPAPQVREVVILVDTGKSNGGLSDRCGRGGRDDSGGHAAGRSSSIGGVFDPKSSCVWRLNSPHLRQLSKPNRLKPWQPARRWAPRTWWPASKPLWLCSEPTRTRNRHLIYVGDGISQADLPSHSQFARMVDLMVAHRISFSSYAIGPQRDVRMLVALANQTGGQVFIDSVVVTGQQAGQAIAESLASNVIWLDDDRAWANTTPRQFRLCVRIGIRS